jgi:hypothetical protein
LFCVPGVACGWLTVTFTERFTEPSEFVAVSVYVVVAAGDTMICVSPVTLPTPWLIASESAPATAHDSVTGWPAITSVSFAVNDEIAGPGNTASGPAAKLAATSSVVSAVL